MFERIFFWEAIAAIVCYCASVACYRLFWHPLAQFPGPKLAAITRYYEAYYDVIQGGKYTSKIERMHNKYGPIVRISPYELHIRDPAYFEKLFRHDGHWDKYAWASSAQGAPGSFIFTSDHDLHKARRQPLNAYFSKARVASQQGLIDEKLGKLCQRIKNVSGTGKVIDLGAALSAMERDMLHKYVIGKECNDLDEEDFARTITRFAEAGGTVWRLTKHVRWYGPMLLSIPKEFIIKIADDTTATFLRYAMKIEKETRRLMDDAVSPAPGNGTQRTIVHEIMDSKLPPEDKTEQRIFGDVATVTGAGVETTGSVMRLIIYHVFSNTKILERLRAELSSAGVASNSWGNPADLRALEQLPYLTAVLMEGLRLAPALGTRLQRVAPDRDIFYNEWRIPAGTPVGMSPLFMHMDKDLYPDPTRFDPDRWVDVHARKKAERTFAPFSRGTRNCIGMHLAWANLYLVLPALIQRFDFDFLGLMPDNFEFVSDMFILGIKGKHFLNVIPTLH